jgi:hypothetical protein
MCIAVSARGGQQVGTCSTSLRAEYMQHEVQPRAVVVGQQVGTH